MIALKITLIALCVINVVHCIDYMLYNEHEHANTRYKERGCYFVYFISSISCLVLIPAIVSKGMISPIIFATFITVGLADFFFGIGIANDYSDNGEPLYRSPFVFIILFVLGVSFILYPIIVNKSYNGKMSADFPKNIEETFYTYKRTPFYPKIYNDGSACGISFSYVDSIGMKHSAIRSESSIVIGMYSSLNEIPKEVIKNGNTVFVYSNSNYVISSTPNIMRNRGFVIIGTTVDSYNSFIETYDMLNNANSVRYTVPESDVADTTIQFEYDTIVKGNTTIITMKERK